jgi:diguanylate cyclase (GGDEF)-like protein/PAS domain S-box-containing protein
MSDELLHPLLARQLAKLALSADTLPEARGWSALLARVSRAYADHEQTRYLLERSEALALDEMEQLNAMLRAERDHLEARVQERTAALVRSEGRLNSLLSLSSDWVWEQDEELRFTFVSEGIANTGVAPEALLGRQRLWDDSFEADPNAVMAYRACLEARTAFRDFTFSRRRPDGSVRHIRTSGTPVFDADGKFRGYRGVSRDVTEAVTAERKVQDLARYDTLTGLPNRNLFRQELEHSLAAAKERNREFALCFIDLDRFKAVNDTLGHHAGDELLQQVAQRLRSALRRTDTIARLGGDEFVVLLDGQPSPDELRELTQALLQTISEPFIIQGSEFLVSASIGIGRYPQDGTDADTLLRRADAAMYRAKQNGRNNVQVYTADDAALADQKLELEAALRKAIVRNELLLHYQPKLEAATGALTGVEALVRWHHPTRGLVPPSEFIPLAEERGMIVALGHAVFQAGCRQIQAWRAAGVPVPTVAINLSARQFADVQLLARLQSEMQRYGVQPADLEVELTESTLMADPQRAKQVLDDMSAMGLRIAIDDFGTGYSSLSYLKRFPADEVKIDRSFVNGLPDDGDDATITQAVIAMAHSLGLRVVAEGVETSGQLTALRRMQCDEVQGFLFAKPMAAEDLVAWLEGRNRAMWMATAPAAPVAVNAA